MILGLHYTSFRKIMSLETNDLKNLKKIAVGSDDESWSL